MSNGVNYFVIVVFIFGAILFCNVGMVSNLKIFGNLLF